MNSLYSKALTEEQLLWSIWNSFMSTASWGCHVWRLFSLCIRFFFNRNVCYTRKRAFVGSDRGAGVWVHTRKHTHTHTHMHACTHSHTHACTRMHVHVHARTCHTQTHTHTQKAKKYCRKWDLKWCMCISHNTASSFHCHTCWLEFKMPLPPVEKTKDPGLHLKGKYKFTNSGLRFIPKRGWQLWILCWCYKVSSLVTITDLFLELIVGAFPALHFDVTDKTPEAVSFAYRSQKKCVYIYIYMDCDHFCHQLYWSLWSEILTTYAAF